MLREGRDGTIWVGTTTDSTAWSREGRRSLRPIEIGIPNDYPEQGHHCGCGGRCARLALDCGAGRLVSPVARRQRGALHHARGLPHDYLTDLLEDHEGRLWAGTRDVGFFRLS